MLQRRVYRQHDLSWRIASLLDDCWRGNAVEPEVAEVLTRLALAEHRPVRAVVLDIERPDGAAGRAAFSVDITDLKLQLVLQRVGQRTVVEPDREQSAEPHRLKRQLWQPVKPVR